jgi:hypothetical protein
MKNASYRKAAANPSFEELPDEGSERANAARCRGISDQAFINNKKLTNNRIKFNF